jgi:hypothetical protein
MPTLTTQYVYFGSSGAHTRQPRATTSYGGFSPIPTLNPSGTATLTTGSAFQAGPVDADMVISGVEYVFAYQNVSGLNEGPQVSFAASTPPTAGTVGTVPVLVLVVYVPKGGSGNGDTGAVIDAFNETAGSLVDNDFVAVSPDPGGTLTTEANVDGWVDTTSTNPTITADHPSIGAYSTDPTNLTFDRWVVLTNPTPPTSLVSGANLTPTHGVGTVYALAFYKVPAKTLPEKILKEYIKEFEKIQVKELIQEGGKPFVTDAPVKGIKEQVEIPGGIGNTGDPGNFGPVLQNLTQRIAKLEAAAKAAPKGEAFIKPKDRPAVGKAKTLKRRDS